MAGNPTGSMGLADYLGDDFKSAGALPIVNIPGCPVQPENFMETLTWMLYHAAGSAPLDHKLRPRCPLAEMRKVMQRVCAQGSRRGQALAHHWSRGTSKSVHSARQTSRGSTPSSMASAAVRPSRAVSTWSTNSDAPRTGPN